MKKTVMIAGIVLICAVVICAASFKRLPKADAAALDTDKIIEVRCTVHAAGNSMKISIPKQLFELAISTFVVYDKDASKGAVIKMRVPLKYESDVSQAVLEICPSCRILSVTAVPISTPTAVAK